MDSAYNVYNVFTPTTQAKLNFVDRPEVNDQLVDALLTPGKQLIVYGESGSGKSTLVQKKLEETYEAHITTQCSRTMTYEQLLLNAFDQLDRYYIEGRSSQKSRSISPSIRADFHRVRATIDANLSSTTGQSEARILAPQLTPQRLAQFLGEQRMCWVVEDFHKMLPEYKTAFAQSMKVFSDASALYPEVKTIIIGATDTARQVVEYDPEMANRVSELLVPLMTDNEISGILINGQKLLNIDLTELIIPIVEYAVGVPSICHQLGLNVCLEKQVMVRQISKRALSIEDLKPAVERYVRESSDTLKARFDKALTRHKIRKFDNCRLILSAIAGGPLSGMRAADILASIRSHSAEYPAGNLTLYLRELTQDKRGSVLRVGSDGKYRFADPLYHTFAQAILLVKARIKPEEPYVASVAVNALATYWNYNNADTNFTFKVTPGSQFDSIWSSGGNVSTISVPSEPQRPQLVAAPERRLREPTIRPHAKKPSDR
jgi:GTPase SAR1 family protein